MHDPSALRDAKYTVNAKALRDAFRVFLLEGHVEEKIAAVSQLSTMAGGPLANHAERLSCGCTDSYKIANLPLQCMFVNAIPLGNLRHASNDTHAITYICFTKTSRSMRVRSPGICCGKEPEPCCWTAAQAPCCGKEPEPCCGTAAQAIRAAAREPEPCCGSAAQAPCCGKEPESCCGSAAQAPCCHASPLPACCEAVATDRGPTGTSTERLIFSAKKLVRRFILSPLSGAVSSSSLSSGDSESPSTGTTLHVFSSSSPDIVQLHVG